MQNPKGITETFRAKWSHFSLSLSSSSPFSTTLLCYSTLPSLNRTCFSYTRWDEPTAFIVFGLFLMHALLISIFTHLFTLCAFPFLFLCVQRLSSLLIFAQVVNQFTEVVVPYVVDRFYSSSQKELKEDDPAADHMQAEGSLPPFPVSCLSLTVKPCIRNLHRHEEYTLPKLLFFLHVWAFFFFEKYFILKKGFFCLLQRKTLIYL